jgi:hypothetical protein
MGPLGMVWKHSNKMKYSTTANAIEQLAKGISQGHTLIRLFTAGDIPNEPSLEDGLSQTHEIISACMKQAEVLNIKVHVWGYTHNTDQNTLAWLAELNDEFSEANCNGSSACIRPSLHTTDELASCIEMGLPFACVTKPDIKLEHVVCCPAQQNKTVTCLTCAKGKPLCSNAHVNVAFMPHGPAKKYVLAI